MQGVGMIRLVARIIVASLCVPLAAAPAPRLVVEAPTELEAVANEVRALGEGDFSEVLHLTGRTGFTRPIQVMLVPEDAPLARGVPEWVSGYARGRDAVIVLFPARVRSYPDRNLRTLLHHEVAHVLVAEAAGGRLVPRWFNEGIATVAAREWGLEDRARFAMAVLGSQPQSASDLDAAFQGSGPQVQRAYALSSAFVRFIQKTYGAQAPALVLGGLAADLTFETAFRRATGDSLPRAEEIFFEDEAFWTTWVPFLTSTGALWMAITILALVAFQHHRARRRARLEAWEREEAAGGMLQGRIVHPDRDDTVN
jgi:hypothetical protein